MYLFSILSEDDKWECLFCFDIFELGQLSKTLWKLLKRYCHNLLGLPKQNTIYLVAKNNKNFFLTIWKLEVPNQGLWWELPFWLRDDWLLAVPFLWVRMKREGMISLVYLIRMTILLNQGWPSWLHLNLTYLFVDPISK